MAQAPADRQEIRKWPRAYLKDVVIFRSGSRNSDTAVADGEFPFFVCSKEVLRSNEFDFDGEAVIMAGNNADGVFHLHHFTGKFAARQRTYVITPSTKRLDCRYLFYQLAVLQRSFQAAAIGTTTRYVTIEMLRGAEVPLPELAIQRAIAEALSDADALIESLEQLLAKKRQLKQGAMQELLTGKKRLPGFSGKWGVRRLDDLGRWTGGMTPSMRQPDYWQPGTVPWISSGDVKSLRLTATASAVSGYALRQRVATLLPAKSIIVVTRSGILRRYLPVAMNMIPMAINQDIKALLPNDDALPEYLLHSLAFNGPLILARCLKSGTTVESIEFPWLKAFTIPIPTPVEQTAIAAILSDMDAEIAALEGKLAKARDLKQGMMQELLTGRIRLPV